MGRSRRAEVPWNVGRAVVSNSDSYSRCCSLKSPV